MMKKMRIGEKNEKYAEKQEEKEEGNECLFRY